MTRIDPRISCEDFQMEILHVGLLCVQEFAADRPTVSAVLSMLTSETDNLDKPKQTAFTQIPDPSKAQSSQGRIIDFLLQLLKADNISNLSYS